MIAVADGMVLFLRRADYRVFGPLLEMVVAAAPLRRMMTPGGLPMSVAMSNCGEVGWVSDRGGYRYAPVDPVTGRPWPALPEPFTELATATAADAGFPCFRPNACLINEYRPGARMGYHQDRDEQDFSQPVVSVSFGLRATFMVKGTDGCGRALQIPLEHGDVLVFGGPARLRHHGVKPVKPGCHSAVGERRLNLTFRRAGKAAG